MQLVNWCSRCCYAIQQMPLVLSKLLQLSPSIQLGLLYVACLPGGGFAYLIASVFASHSVSVSATYNFICTFATLGRLDLHYFSVYFITQPSYIGRHLTRTRRTWFDPRSYVKVLNLMRILVSVSYTLKLCLYQRLFVDVNASLTRPWKPNQFI